MSQLLQIKGVFLKMTKASEIFLKYAAPVMEQLPASISITEIENLIRVPELVWNAVAMETWENPKKDYISKIYKSFDGQSNNEARIFKSMIDMWIDRKRKLFPNENWAMEIKVRKGKTGPVIRAYVRLPEHLKEKAPKEWQRGNLRQIDFHG